MVSPPNVAMVAPVLSMVAKGGSLPGVRQRLKRQMERKTHYFTLDFLRILSAILVLLSHFATYAAKTASIADGKDVAFRFLSVFAGLGAAGVGTLFAISGFALAMSASRDGGMAPALRFARIRATRILPALWLSALVSLGARAFYGEDIHGLLLAFARSAILSPKGPYIDGVVWSLVVQMVFYFLVAASILSKFRLSLYDLAKLIGLSSSAYLLLLSGLHLMPSSMKSDEAISVLSRFPFKVFLLQHGVFFAAGIIFYLSSDDRIEGRSVASMKTLFLLFWAMGVVEVIISIDSPEEYRGLAAIILSIFISIMVLGKWHDRFISERLNNHRKIVRYLGGLSYSIYLNHYVSGMVLVWWLFQLKLSAPVVLVVSGFCVLSLSSAVTWLERRIQNAINARFQHPRPGRATLAIG